MRDLSLEGLSEDKRYLVARDVTTGATYRIPADHRLTSLIGSSSRTSSRTPSRAGSTSGQMEIRMPSSLTPRDIQTRIRRGESPQTVADSAGVPVAQIEGFAGPVLAEREFMCEQARKTTIRRKHIGGAGVQLGVLVSENILAGGGTPEDATWDSWRREDGRWTVLVTPADAAHPATFLFDVKSRYVLPADEFAHELVGDVALPDSTDMAIADAVRSSEPPAAPDAPVQDVVDHADAAEPSPVEIPDPIEAVEEQALTGVSSLKEARDRRAMGQLALGDAADAPADDASPSSAEEFETDEFETELDQDIAVPDTMGPRKKRHERRRVPSWDEIMFGDSKND